MKRSSKELTTLLILVGDVYKKLEDEIPDDVNWMNVLKLASINRMLYYSIIRLLKSNITKNIDKSRAKLIIRLRMLGEEQLLLLKKTLGALNTALGARRYLVLKTYREYPCVTHDVDILVNDLQDTATSLRRHGFLIKQGERYKGGAHRDGLLPIGLHEKVSWGTIAVVDEDLLWKNPRKTNVQGIETFLPSIEGDLLTYLAHINFEEYKVTLRDLLYIYKLSRVANWNTVMLQVRKYGWEQSMKITVAIINDLHRQLYSEPSPIEEYIPTCINVKLELPYRYPLHFLLKIFTEKKALKHFVWDLPVYAYERFEAKIPKPIVYSHLGYHPLRILRPIEAFWHGYFGLKYLQ